MVFFEKNGRQIAVIDASEQINGTQTVLDLMATARYEDGCTAIVFYQESLGEGFFDLKTGFAGEILQKFSNYRVQLAIVGNFSIYKSKALRDFIYECNNGNLVFFKESLDEALEALAPNRKFK